MTFFRYPVPGPVINIAWIIGGLTLAYCGAKGFHIKPEWFFVLGLVITLFAACNLLVTGILKLERGWRKT